MELKAKLIIAMTAMCLLTTTALSQGGPRDGSNGGPEREMWQGEENGMMFGQGNSPSSQGGETEHGQIPVPPKFKGCNTDPRNMPNDMPVKSPPDNPKGSVTKLGPNDATHDGPEPWTYTKLGDGQNDGPSFGFAGHDGQMPPRSIMGEDHLQVPPKKSMMDMEHYRVHKGPLKPLNPEDLPELPPMKSMMDHH
ncbi:MAG: hypothetical protein PHQ34_10180 [Methanothrix sp.]|nr:hypothetical protein [Methanothrix sp.]